MHSITYRILVCGGREFTDYEALDRALDEIIRQLLDAKAISNVRQVTIINGAAKGVDKLSSQWADEHGAYCWEFPAKWKTHGKAAGPIRNKEMLDTSRPHLVVAFPGGKGTENMVGIAKKAEVQIIDLRG